jgi:hypothetical protein
MLDLSSEEEKKKNDETWTTDVSMHRLRCIFYPGVRGASDQTYAEKPNTFIMSNT